MTRQRLILIAAIALVLTGAVLAGYPLYLSAESYLDQLRLEKAFQDYVAELNQNLDDQESEQNRQWQDLAPVLLPQWEDFPPTRLEIPALDVAIQVVAVDDMGVFAEKLNQQPSYFPDSALPGQVGNVTIAGHRGGPAGRFQELETLKPGEQIILQAPGVSYYYEVERVFYVEPTEVHVVAPLDYAALTIVTCKRVGTNSSALRTIVRAKFIEAIPSGGE